MLAIKAHSYQESACQSIIDHMIQCCTQWEHLQTVSCSGFSAKSQEGTGTNQGNHNICYIAYQLL